MNLLPASLAVILPRHPVLSACCPSEFKEILKCSMGTNLFLAQRQYRLHGVALVCALLTRNVALPY